jgi:hypothetical protein
MSIDRSSKGLVETMFLELEALKDGNSTPQQARSKAAVVNTICALTRLEMDYARFVAGERAEPLPNGQDGLKALPMQA